MECPVCKKGFNEHTGRRPKKFCSDGCKVKFWNTQKRVVDGKLDEAVKKYTSFESASEFIEFKTSVDNSEKIKELEEEIKTIPDIGLGKKRRQFLEQQIRNFKR